MTPSHMLMDIGTPFSHDLLAHAGVIVVCDVRACSAESHVVQLCLGTDDHSTLSGKLRSQPLILYARPSPRDVGKLTWKLALGVPR